MLRPTGGRAGEAHLKPLLLRLPLPKRLPPAVRKSVRAECDYQGGWVEITLPHDWFPEQPKPELKGWSAPEKAAPKPGFSMIGGKTVATQPPRKMGAAP